ncbi:hypothetical protein CRG98_018087 [Punica granatum]|uniref:Retrotransposon gag domain-containing protein n=1 Tax=Punica granatum TaxID=22663 RepID=A0A2I0K0A0_PUNGR|nr:hypothetical protein CRG98_018087 [Punica granatum]
MLAHPEVDTDSWGSITKLAEGSADEDKWIPCNSMIAARISSSLGKERQLSIACIEEAKALLDDLRERFSQGNETRIYEIKSWICLLKQEGRYVSEYYLKLKGKSQSCSFCDKRETGINHMIMVDLSVITATSPGTPKAPAGISMGNRWIGSRRSRTGSKESNLDSLVVIGRKGSGRAGMGDVAQMVRLIDAAYNASNRQRLVDSRTNTGNTTFYIC